MPRATSPFTVKPASLRQSPGVIIPFPAVRRRGFYGALAHPLDAMERLSPTAFFATFAIGWAACLLATGAVLVWATRGRL